MEALAASSPEILEQKLITDRAYARAFPARVHALLASPQQRDAALGFFAHAAQVRLRRIAAKGEPWTDRDINEFLTLAFIDPRAFFSGSEDYRRQVLAHLGRCFDASCPDTLRRRLLTTVARLPGIDFDGVERVAVAWKVAVRSSADRRWTPADAGWRTLDDGAAPIHATVFSLPSRFFDATDCLALLRACRERRPERALIALTDHGSTADERGAVFRAEAAKLGIDLIDPLGREFSPWLRDPFLFVSRGSQEVAIFSRPNAQSGREHDTLAARQIIQGLSPEVDRRFGGWQWTPMPMPFHGGHLIHAPEATWISVHSVEERVLELLKQKVLDVVELKKAEPWRRYANAVDAAARELAQLCQRPVRFVHPWPVDPNGPDHLALVGSLSGGNDADLDVLLTVLPTGSSPTVLVGDIDLGLDGLRQASADELADFARRFQIARSPEVARTELLEYQQSARIRALDAFLEMVARHFQDEGRAVRRTPLVQVPTRLIAGHPKFAADQPHAHFPIGFSNVVLETTPADGASAEGFGSGLPSLDRVAESVFTAAGYRLTLYRPLVESLIGEGGYRCATQEIRLPAR